MCVCLCVCVCVCVCVEDTQRVRQTVSTPDRFLNTHLPAMKLPEIFHMCLLVWTGEQGSHLGWRNVLAWCYFLSDRHTGPSPGPGDNSTQAGLVFTTAILLYGPPSGETSGYSHVIGLDALTLPVCASHLVGCPSSDTVIWSGPSP